MDKLAWFFHNHGGQELLARFWLTLLVGFVLYQSNYLQILVRVIVERGWRPPGPRLAPGECPDALLVLPTLLTRDAELDGLRRAITSVLANGYPGGLVICAAIDHADRARGLVRRLQTWVARLELPAAVEVLVAPTPRRVGKAMGIEHALDVLRGQIARGERRGWPAVLFSMDADSEVTPGSLERISARLMQPRRWSGERPLIVPANLGVRPAHSWRGWRHFFTVAGQLSLQVAREFTVTCSLNRHNQFRILPVLGVSGALYGTWTELYLHAPRYGAFMKSLRVRDWLRWWLGAPPPSYAAFDGSCPEASIGPGDDTWIAWLAISARWNAGRIDLELPPTPWHALVRAVRAYLVRAVAFEPEARVYTSTPTKIRALYKQRIRWNSSRVWLSARFGLSLFYKWQLGAVVLLEILLVLGFGSMILLFFLLLPFVRADDHWLGYMLVAAVAGFLVRSGATVLGMLQERELPHRWHKLLALPLSGIYSLVFNISTTMLGYAKDLLGFGLNTGFAPEETLERSGTGRLALAYRLRRLVLVAWRALRHGDVPPGGFWFGWNETPWTPSGYTGWTNPARKSPPVQPRRR